MPSTTVLKHLSRDPVPVRYVTSSSTASKLTDSEYWQAIEGVRAWKDFNYQVLSKKFSKLLDKTLPTFDLASAIEQSHLTDIGMEDTVTALFTTSILIYVNTALARTDKGKGLHFAPGSKFSTQLQYGNADWGLGSEGVMNTSFNTFYNLCPGEIKPGWKWNSEGLLEAPWGDGYEDDPKLRSQCLPLEQVQYYAVSSHTRYGWIWTEKELVVMRFTKSADPERTSPRPIRSNPITNRHRVMSDASMRSMLSNSLSEMSMSDGSFNSAGSNLTWLEIMVIPSESGQKMTPALALFFLAHLSNEKNALATEYPPLDPKGTKTSAHATSHNQTKASSQRPAQYDDKDDEDDENRAGAKAEDEESYDDALDTRNCTPVRVIRTKERDEGIFLVCELLDGSQMELLHSTWERTTLRHYEDEEVQVVDGFKYKGRSGTIYVTTKLEAMKADKGKGKGRK